MDRAKEAELFQNLARHPRFLEWLQDQKAAVVEILLVNPDRDTILKAQGRASMVQSMLDKLTATEPTTTR